jgi:hypothetical protein
MRYNGNVYKLDTDVIGNITITRRHDGASCFLQGDDTNELYLSLDALDNTVYPSGPFKNYKAHLDAVLDAYESVIR